VKPDRHPWRQRQRRHPLDGVTIRGFSASNDFYLDGLRDDMQYTRDLGNIERVEVLKGPAAVLYGRGSTAASSTGSARFPRRGRPPASAPRPAASTADASPPTSTARAESGYRCA
jgi:iron complex outermembrane receptor protein